MEAEKDGKVKTVVASCGYPAEPGLVIRTRSPRIDRIRRAVIELVAPQANTDGDLRRRPARSWPMSTALTSIVSRRACRPGRAAVPCAGSASGTATRWWGRNAIGFVGRGIDRRVAFFPEKASKVCANCLGCFKICPTGKIGAESDGTYFGFTVDDFLAGRL